MLAQHVYRDLDRGELRPLCLVVGEEPFQAMDIELKFKRTIIRSETESQFNLERWDGEHLDANRLMNSLETLPGLFGEGGSKRLVILKQFEKASASAIDTLGSYFENPSNDTVLLIFTAKADRRRSYFRSIEEHGYWIEVNEPYERDWPKWLPFFERKCGKKIEGDAWELLVAATRSLSLIWAQVQTLSLFVGEAPTIHKRDVLTFTGTVSGTDIFSFVDDVINRRRKAAIEKLHHLTLSSESEIKLLALIVRQFRLMDQARQLSQAGIIDPVAVSSHLGVHRFGVGPLIQNAKKFSQTQFRECFERLSETDYRMKLGGGGLFENFLVWFFGR